VVAGGTGGFAGGAGAFAGDVGVNAAGNVVARRGATARGATLVDREPQLVLLPGLDPKISLSAT
jgi:hypothetical protein